MKEPWKEPWELAGLVGGRHGGLVRMGDFLVPHRAVATYIGAGLESDCRVFLEVRDGRPEVTGVAFTMKQGGRGLRPRDLHVLELELDGLASEAFEQLAVRPGQSSEPDTILLFTPRTEAERHAAKQTARAARKAHRGSPTRAELEQVAATYRKHLAGSPNLAVREVMGYSSDRTTARRVSQARAAGLLPKTTMGRRRA